MTTHSTAKVKGKFIEWIIVMNVHCFHSLILGVQRLRNILRMYSFN